LLRLAWNQPSHRQHPHQDRPQVPACLRPCCARWVGGILCAHTGSSTPPSLLQPQTDPRVVGGGHAPVAEQADLLAGSSAPAPSMDESAAATGSPAPT
jgi:hypothetical protein